MKLLKPSLLFAAALSFQAAKSQDFLKAFSGKIVNAPGEEVLLRGIGLGGWMIQEGYMLHGMHMLRVHAVKGGFRFSDLVFRSVETK